MSASIIPLPDFSVPDSPAWSCCCNHHSLLSFTKISASASLIPVSPLLTDCPVIPFHAALPSADFLPVLWSFWYQIPASLELAVCNCVFEIFVCLPEFLSIFQLFPLVLSFPVAIELRHHWLESNLSRHSLSHISVSTESVREN